jgi:hypothetical protein
MPWRPLRASARRGPGVSADAYRGFCCIHSRGSPKCRMSLAVLRSPERCRLTHRARDPCLPGVVDSAAPVRHRPRPRRRSVRRCKMSAGWRMRWSGARLCISLTRFAVLRVRPANWQRWLVGRPPTRSNLKPQPWGSGPGRKHRRTADRARWQDRLVPVAVGSAAACLGCKLTVLPGMQPTWADGAALYRAFAEHPTRARNHPACHSIGSSLARVCTAPPSALPAHALLTEDAARPAIGRRSCLGPRGRSGGSLLYRRTWREPVSTPTQYLVQKMPTLGQVETRRQSFIRTASFRRMPGEGAVRTGNG